MEEIIGIKKNNNKKYSNFSILNLNFFSKIYIRTVNTNNISAHAFENIMAIGKI